MGVFAQSFAPFTASGRKLFASVPDQHNGYSLAFDSVATNGNLTTYYNFSTAWDTLTPSNNCVWWVGNECFKQEKPTWLGGRIDKDAAGMHTFFNLWNEPISVPFHTDDQDTVLMYADGSQQFLLSYDSEGSTDVLGLVDNVRQWTIHHRDLSNNPIPSPINGAVVRVGETMGLVDFFRIDSFPQVLEPVEIIGLQLLGLGLYQLTPALLEDHQPGDEVQWHEYYHLNFGPPWNNYDRYRKYVYLDRTDTQDSVLYTAHQEWFNVGELTLHVDTIQLAYAKNTVIASIPFERFDGTRPMLRKLSYCGIPMWTYDTFLNTGLAYCTEEKCWGPFDTNGPPSQGGTTVVVGLGTFRDHSYIVSPNGYQADDRIVYFKKDGVVCYDEIAMGTPRPIAEQPTVEVFPDPTDGRATFRTSHVVMALEVMDPLGRVVHRSTPFSNTGEIDLTREKNGAYLVRARFANGSMAVQRVIRQ